jgi:hypothetical protein
VVRGLDGVGWIDGYNLTSVAAESITLVPGRVSWVKGKAAGFIVILVRV